MKVKRMLSKNRCSGLVLPLVATIVVFIFLIGIAVLKVGFGGRYIAAMTSTQIAARSAADAGLTVAMHEMNKKLLVRPWDNSTLPSAADVRLPNCRAYYSYTVTDNLAGGYTITSTGKCDRETRNVYAMTRRTSFWSYAIAVENTITFGSKIVMDVWDPDGNYLGLTPDIRTSSTEPDAVKLKPNSELPGDVVVGPGGDPESVIQVKPNADIHGETYAADTVIDFPDVVLPVGLPPLAAWPGDPCSVLTAPYYSYSSINLGTGERLEIRGNVVMYVAGPMRLGNDSTLYIAPNSSLALYLENSFTAVNSSRIINGIEGYEDARNLCMYGTSTCTNIVINNSGKFCGAIYAPSARLEIKNSGATYGAFIGDSFEMKNSGEFYYDARLYDFDPTGGLSFFQVERWWER